MKKSKFKRFMIGSVLVGEILLLLLIILIVYPQKPEDLKTCLLVGGLSYICLSSGLEALFYNEIKSTLEE